MSTLVFPDYHPEIQVIQPFPIPLEYDIYIGMDMGYINPSVAVWCAVSKEYDVFVYRELYKTQIAMSEFDEIVDAYTKTKHVAGYIRDEYRVRVDERYHIMNSFITNAFRPSSVSFSQETNKFSVKTGRVFFFDKLGIVTDTNLSREGHPTSILEEMPRLMLDRFGKLPERPANHAIDALSRVLHYIYTKKPRIIGRFNWDDSPINEW